MVQTRRASALRDISNKGAAGADARPGKRARKSGGGAGAAAAQPAGSSVQAVVDEKAAVSVKPVAIAAPVQPVDVADMGDVENPQARSPPSHRFHPVITWQHQSPPAS